MDVELVATVLALAVVILDLVICLTSMEFRLNNFMARLACPLSSCHIVVGIPFLYIFFASEKLRMALSSTSTCLY